MTDRYENIRKALAIGPASGPYKQSEFTPQRVDTRSGSINVAWYCNFDNGAREAEAEATAAHIAACDPDTIRALLVERDTLEELLLAYIQVINKIDDRAEYALPMPPETRRELHAILSGLTAKLAAIAAANGGGNG